MTRSWRPRISATRPGRASRRWTIASSDESHSTTRASAWASTSPNAAGEVGKQPAGVDHDIGVEGAERIGDGRPGLLVGDGLAHAGETEQDRKATGELFDVVPDGLGGEGAPGRGEQRGEAAGDGHAVAGGEVAAEGVGLDQEDPASGRASSPPGRWPRW